VRVPTPAQNAEELIGRMPVAVAETHPDHLRQSRSAAYSLGSWLA
jgi:hypothetical protein